jgi:hypothetical protein
LPCAPPLLVLLHVDYSLDQVHEEIKPIRFAMKKAAAARWRRQRRRLRMHVRVVSDLNYSHASRLPYKNGKDKIIVDFFFAVLHNGCVFRATENPQ